MKNVLTILTILLLTASAFAQNPACELVAPHSGPPVPATYELLVGAHDWQADYDFSGTPACSASVTSSCIVALNFYRDNEKLATCNVPATAAGVRGLATRLTLNAPLKLFEIKAGLTYRDGAGALVECSTGALCFSNIPTVTLRPNAPGQIKKR